MKWTPERVGLIALLLLVTGYSMGRAHAVYRRMTEPQRQDAVCEGVQELVRGSLNVCVEHGLNLAQDLRACQASSARVSR